MLDVAFCHQRAPSEHAHSGGDVVDRDVRHEAALWVIPSLTLCPLGKDRSTIRRRLFSFPHLGMTPNLLSTSEAAGNQDVAAPTFFCEVIVNYVRVLLSRAHIVVAQHGAAEP